MKHSILSLMGPSELSRRAGIAPHTAIARIEALGILPDAISVGGSRKFPLFREDRETEIIEAISKLPEVKS